MSEFVLKNADILYFNYPTLNRQTTFTYVLFILTIYSDDKKISSNCT